ncbi:hypothetical protein OBK19_12800 [Empedobacter falsenii]|uniref:Uncharacterized protein n=1 Tax=Empedobacter falsenii TaxID=343874 RepID=A0ABY8VAA7_9FLAO|nr:hypothetical protein [Empedobacter falsenii]WIH98344.1 hypothetical protein OBA43_05300 [Empedobacter falsenii]
MDKKKIYTHPIFVTELISKLTVLELFDIIKDFEVYQQIRLSNNESDKGNITYGIIVNNHHFEGDEKETKIFLIGLLLSQKQRGVINV